MGLLAVSAAPSAKAQDQAISPSSWDVTAAREAVKQSVHATPPHSAATRGHVERTRLDIRPSSAAPSQGNGSQTQNPGDLTYQGGAVVTHAQSHAIYVLNQAVHCTTPSCWGNPEGFLQDLGASDFIHITDQYVGRTDDNRYTVGSHASVNFKLPSVPLTDSDVLAVIHAVASKSGLSGYHHIYHVFLPPGTDECFDSTFTACYSPDNPYTFGFCAYHSSADFTDIGHVLYSVEPFQNVAGCNDLPGPNGQTADSTNDTWSHELFETITDPDGTAWYNFSNLGLLFDEVGDECEFLLFTSNADYGNPLTFKMNGKSYQVQTEYSNSAHACTIRP